MLLERAACHFQDQGYRVRVRPCIIGDTGAIHTPDLHLVKDGQRQRVAFVFDELDGTALLETRSHMARDMDADAVFVIGLPSPEVRTWAERRRAVMLEEGDLPEARPPPPPPEAPVAAPGRGAAAAPSTATSLATAPGTAAPARRLGRGVPPALALDGPVPEDGGAEILGRPTPPAPPGSDRGGRDAVMGEDDGLGPVEAGHEAVDSETPDAPDAPDAPAAPEVPVEASPTTLHVEATGEPPAEPLPEPAEAQEPDSGAVLLPSRPKPAEATPAAASPAATRPARMGRGRIDPDAPVPEDGGVELLPGRRNGGGGGDRDGERIAKHDPSIWDPRGRLAEVKRVARAGSFDATGQDASAQPRSGWLKGLRAGDEGSA